MPFSSRHRVDPSALVSERELREIAKALLSVHAQINHDSAFAIRSVALGAKITEVAATQGTYTKRITRLITHDYQELQELLSTAFRIDRLDDIA
jgi:hypothetical protein